MTSEMQKFIDSMNATNKCIECVEHVGYGDSEYNVFNVNGVWEDDGGLKVSLNDGNTEIYMHDWNQFNVLLNEEDENDVADDENVDDISDGLDNKYVFEFAFGDVKRKFIIF